MQRHEWRFHDDPVHLKCGDSEPIAAIGNPPCDKENGNSRGQTQPKRKQKIREQPEHCEDQPEDFPLHEVIVGHRTLERTTDLSADGDSNATLPYHPCSAIE
jgi:hypothetical protein